MPGVDEIHTSQISVCSTIPNNPGKSGADTYSFGREGWAARPFWVIQMLKVGIATLQTP